MDKKLTRQEREKIQIEQTILQHAESLFRKNGYTHTSMDVLSASCEYTKRTIYRYFTCKEDLYYAVILKGQQEMLAAVQAKMNFGTNGIEKIILAIEASRDFFLENEPLFELMSQIKVISNNQENIRELPYYQKYVKYVQHMVYDELLKLFQAAQTENAIRNDVEVSKLAFSALFQFMAFLQMYAIAGDTYIEYFSLDKTEFIDFSLKAILKMLNNYDDEGKING